MKLSLDWLNQYIDLSGESPERIGEALTGTGLEVEGVEQVDTVPGGLRGLLVGEVLTCGPHPDADKLRVTTVDVGAGEPLPIVCGAPNVAAGQKVVVATVGTTIHPTEGEPFTIKKAKIRGQASQGMICAEDEIGLGADHDGIIVLDTDLPNGTPAAEHYQVKTDTVYEIGLTPNRADAASHYGSARDLRAVFGKPLAEPDAEAFAPDEESFPIEVEVRNPEACPRYAGLTISGLTIGPSPDWMQNRLRAIGLAPINNVVDATNYVLHGLGQPLHAFDADKVAGNKVVVSTLPKGTKFTTLDEKERELTEDDLMICDGDVQPMCIGGVFGGLDSGVSESTTRIFLESAYFHPDHIRRTSLHHGLKTDAAFRFERGTDPNMPVKALKYAALLIKEVAGGRITSDVVDVYPEPIGDFEVRLRLAYVRRLIGVDLEKERVKSILESLDIRIAKETEDALELKVPPYRFDVQREADVIEEILRIYGYDNVPLSEEIGTEFFADFPQHANEKLKERIGAELAAAGFHEIVTNSLVKPEYAEAFGFLPEDETVAMLNPSSREQSVMRQTVAFSGLEVVAHNVNRQQPDLKLFEFGKSYRRTPHTSDHLEDDDVHEESYAFEEREFLALFLSGAMTAESWRQPSAPATVRDAVEAALHVFERFPVKGLEVEPFGPDEAKDSGPFAYGVKFVSGGKEYGQAGPLRPEVCKAAEVKQEVFYAELDWQALAESLGEKLTYAPIPRFPSVRRDLSMELDKRVTFKQLKDLAFQTERKLLKSVNAFDVYEGDKIAAGKKSYALSFTLQDDSKTLADKQIDKAMQKLMQAFEKELGAQVRKG